MRNCATIYHGYKILIKQMINDFTDDNRNIFENVYLYSFIPRKRMWINTEGVYI